MTVEYRSSGSVLTFGTDVRVRAAVGGLAPTLDVSALVADGEAGPAAAHVRWHAGRVMAVHGHLGRFTARIVGRDGAPIDRALPGAKADGTFDLVLDLSEPPLLQAEVPPPGYFAPGPEPGGLAPALAALAASVGVFSKPHYFAYDASLCAHGAKGQSGCRRCLPVCPAGAIASAGPRIVVDPHLCQGCGTCTAVCPTGAITLVLPPGAQLRERVRTSLAAHTGASGRAPRLLVHEARDAAAARGHDDTLPVEVGSLASFGVDDCLAALADGATTVSLLAPARLPARSRAAIEGTIALGRAILGAVGDDQTRLDLVDLEVPDGVDAPPPGGPGPTIAAAPAGPAAPAFAAVPTSAAAPEGPEAPATPAAAVDKRAGLLATIDRLRGRSPGAAVVALPQGAELGAVTLDSRACTVCLACVVLCPTGALSGGAGAAAQLRFTEGRCVQCNLCVVGCPEHALGLEPRLLLDPALRDEPRVLKTAEMFACVSCGTPFITRAMLDSVIARVGDHPMFAGDKIDVLRMCPACQQRRMAGPRAPRRPPPAGA